MNEKKCNVLIMGNFKAECSGNFINTLFNYLSYITSNRWIFDSS